MFGQPWRHKLELADVFHNDDLALDERILAVVQRIREAPFFDTEDYELVLVIDEMEETVGDADYFDMVWDAFYDWADANRVWVETF